MPRLKSGRRPSNSHGTMLRIECPSHRTARPCIALIRAISSATRAVVRAPEALDAREDFVAVGSSPSGTRAHNCDRAQSGRVLTGVQRRAFQGRLRSTTRISANGGAMTEAPSSRRQTRKGARACQSVSGTRRADGVSAPKVSSGNSVPSCGSDTNKARYRNAAGTFPCVGSAARGRTAQQVYFFGVATFAAIQNVQRARMLCVVIQLTFTVRASCRSPRRRRRPRCSSSRCTANSSARRSGAAGCPAGCGARRT